MRDLNPIQFPVSPELNCLALRVGRIGLNCWLELDKIGLRIELWAALQLVTEDGYEYQFGINYVRHALFAKLLLSVLVQTAESGRDAVSTCHLV
jgi:hypothetical protein